MSEPLVPDRPGDLAELGVQPHPVTPLDEMAAMEEEAQATTAAEPTIPEPEAPPPEVPEDQVEPSPEDAQPVEAVPEESILQSLLQKEKPSEESELTRLRQDKARLEGLLEGRLQSVEDQIRQKVPDEEPVEEDLLHSAPVRQVLSHLREEDPAEYEAALVRVAEEQATRKMDARFKALEGQIAQEKQATKQEQQATNYQQGIQRVLADIKEQGGLEAELVDQLSQSPQQSYLGQRFQANPAILMSEEGIRGAVASVSAQLKSQYEAQRSTAAPVSPSVEASAGGGSPSTRGVSLGEKPNQLSEEDQIIEDMMNAGNRTRALGFLG